MPSRPTWNLPAICTVLALATILASAPLAAQDRGNAAFADGRYTDAHAIWLDMAEQGDANAQFNLGVLYDEGLGVPADRDAARRYWGMAAKNGLGNAIHNLALLEIDLAGDGPGDLTKARELLEQAAAAGHLAATYSLGKLYEYGLGIDQDDQKAHTHILAAAEGGFAKAQFTLGKRYRDGIAVEASKELALEWFRRAALNGHIGGLDHYARRLNAAATDNVQRVDAMSYAILAARAGHEEATELAEQIQSELTFADLDRAFALAGQFQPRAITGPATQ